MDSSIKNFFYPSAICLVGASTKEKSIGYELLKTIKGYGYTGAIYPVNPKADDVFGYKCYNKIEDISVKIDLAIVVVPKQFVEDSIDSLLSKSVKSIILVTAGFKEMGAAGEELENRLLAKIKKSGSRLVGPNCMGVINTLEEIKLNATFVAEKPGVGSMGFLSQSGAIGAAVLNSLRETNINFAHFISVGNKADINENDLLGFWENDINIKTISLYLESFVNGEYFIKEYMGGHITKPTIVLKAGKTSSGMKAASSHTGALSSKEIVVDALLKQFGIIRASDLKELFNTAKGFESFSIPRGNRIAIVTNAGGPGILAVDSLEKENLALAELDRSTKKKLRALAPPEGSVENPVDLLPGGAADTYRAVNQILTEDENVDAVISIFVEPVMVRPLDVVESVYDTISDKPILQVVMPLPEFWETYRKKSKKNLPLFKNPEDPAEVISNMLFYSQSKIKLDNNRDNYKNKLFLENKSRLKYDPGFLSQKDLGLLCKSYNIPAINNILVKAKNLERLTNNLYPLVLKGINNRIVHKSELNAVALNIKSKKELFACAEEMNNNFKHHGFDIEEFLIQPYLKSKHELLIGGYKDPSFGPIIMFGAGGKYVEVVGDTAIKSAYLADDDVDDLINSTKIGKILHGVRGEESVDINGLKDIIQSSARMIIENKNIAEFDLNPLIVSEDNSMHAVDIRVRVE